MSRADDPYPHYAVLRERAPVFQAGPRRFLVSTLAHGRAVLTDPVFRTRDLSTADLDWPGWEDHASVSTTYRTMLFTNPPDHGGMRRPYARMVTPAALTGLRDTVEGIVEAHLERLSGRDELDFVSELAQPMPMTVMLALMGLSTADPAWWTSRLDAYSRAFEYRPPGNNLADGDAATVELLDRLRIETGSDDPNLLFMLVAGSETTTSMLANGLLLLLTERCGYGSGFVAEALRFEAPIQFSTRVAAADTVVGGVPIATGSVVIVLFGSANRDVPDGERFDPQREQTQLLNFGAGPHYCLGAGLAKWEGELVFPRLLARFPGIALAGAPVRTTTPVLRGLTSLPVRLR